MVSRLMCLGIFASLVALSTAARADSVGFRFADITLVGATGGTGANGTARLSSDVALTGVHGLQLDLGVARYGQEFLGQLDAHLYIMPHDAAKYGLFFSLADIDGREATIAMVGVEGMFALSERTELHGRAGIGMAMPGHMEFVSLSLGASHAVNDQMAIFGDLAIAEVDEAALRAVTTAARIGISYQPAGRSWALSTAFVRDGAGGDTKAASETRAELGFTLHLGGGGGAKRRLAMRGFASTQPLDPLLQRGLF